MKIPIDSHSKFVRFIKTHNPTSGVTGGNVETTTREHLDILLPTAWAENNHVARAYFYFGPESQKETCPWPES